MAQQESGNGTGQDAIAQNKRCRLRIPNPLNIRIKRAREKKWWERLLRSTSFWALLVSTAALVSTIIYYHWPGYAKPLQITAYAIMRGYEFHGYESDHLILPIVWVNNYGPPALVRQPILTLTEKSGNKKTYYVAGHYLEISDLALQKPFTQSQSYLIPGHSAKQINHIFHIENWYKEKKDIPLFKFAANTSYSVTVRYLDADGLCHKYVLGEIETFGIVAKLMTRKQIIAKLENISSAESKKEDSEQRNYQWWTYHPIELGHKNCEPN